MMNRSGSISNRIRMIIKSVRAGRQAAPAASSPSATDADPRDEATQLLAQVEAELRQVDAVHAQIGKHADDAERKLLREIGKHRGSLDVAGNDPDTEGEYLYLLGQLRRARQVQGLANE